MASSAPDGGNDFNREIIEEFRANGGRVNGPLAETTLILIHHVGARSGIERIVPLACSPQDGGSFAIVASNGGSPTHPNWYHNLKAHPRVRVEVGTKTFTVLAEELDGAARDELWSKLVAESPAIGQYQAMTARRIPLLVLTRKDSS